MAAYTGAPPFRARACIQLGAHVSAQAQRKAPAVCHALSLAKAMVGGRLQRALHLASEEVVSSHGYASKLVQIQIGRLLQARLESTKRKALR